MVANGILRHCAQQVAQILAPHISIKNAAVRRFQKTVHKCELREQRSSVYIGNASPRKKRRESVGKTPVINTAMVRTQVADNNKVLEITGKHISTKSIQR